MDVEKRWTADVMIIVARNVADARLMGLVLVNKKDGKKDC